MTTPTVEFDTCVEEAFMIASGVCNTLPTLNHLVALAECAHMLSVQCAALRAQLDGVNLVFSERLH